MQPKEVKAFKNRLRYYSYLTQEINSLEEEIEELYERLGGVRGIDPSKEPVHAMPNKDVEYQLRDSISRLDATLSYKRAEKDEIDRILVKMEPSAYEAVKAVYIEGKLCENVALVHHMSPSGLKDRMNKAIKKALN